MGVHNVFHQLGRRKTRRIHLGLWLVTQFGLELLNHRIGRNSLLLAGFTQGLAPLAAKIDSVRLENPGLCRPFRYNFTDCPIQQWSSRRRIYNSMMAHVVGILLQLFFISKK